MTAADTQRSSTLKTLMIPAGNWHSQGKRKLEENWMEIAFSWPHRGVEINAEVTSQHALGQPELRGTVSLEEVEYLKVWTKPVLRGPLRDLWMLLRCYFRGQNECRESVLYYTSPAADIERKSLGKSAAYQSFCLVSREEVSWCYQTQKH